jgi:predicted transcriptional regulator/DNA-binding XRE family transcriptional regulator
MQEMRATSSKLGRKVRALRRREGITQAALAEKLGISASYLNLIEHDRRPLSAPLLIKLAQLYDLDLKSFAGGEDARLLEDLLEVFGDPIFEDHPVPSREVRELITTAPDVARGVRHLYHAFQTSRASAQSLAERVADGQDLSGVDRVRISSEQVSDFLQRHGNYFHELEEEADRLWNDADLKVEDLYLGLANYLEREHDVRVSIDKGGRLRGALRRFGPDRRELTLSIVLRRGSRNFQLAHQIGLLNCSEILDRLSDAPLLTTEDARALSRVALANYFAAAVLMPYEPFLAATREERYDLDLLGHHFRASFEQVCHRLTTLRRKRMEGVPFHMVRVDIAGNISKKFSAAGIHFPRFSGLCPLWNVHASFQRPGMIRVQISRLPDGTAFFSVARTVRKHRGGYHAPSVLHAIGLGCDLESAKQLVYTDGIDLTNITGVPVGITCRMCDRVDCQARAFPSLQRPLKIDENVRGLSFYTPVLDDE